MENREIVNLLNNKYKGKFIFEVTDNETEIVGFVDDTTFKQIIAVIEPTEIEMNKLIEHLEQHGYYS